MGTSKSFDVTKLAAHRARLLAQGYRRCSAFLSPQLQKLIARHRRRGESVGALLDRLLLSETAMRPRFSTADNVTDAKMIRRTQNQIRHSSRPSNAGPRLLSVEIRESDGSGVLITAHDAVRFEKACGPAQS
ncbi:hypothetical protein IAG25_10870 [Caballeronia sp. EK]|uniref:hypothetical protein n=1 Tax=Caballeronia sp. EK TaxID=2767469 RepID=UPI001655E801|nr:hypothetical protein [Caballeronia sp. EK]MBC8637314.1 hypothetical protein [Caballeronia sp. EK]